VTASDGVSAPCSGSAPTGSCQITLTTAGPVTLTATYTGGGSFAGSADQASHQVQAPAPPKLTVAAQPSSNAELSVPFQPQPQVQLQSADGHALAQSGVTVTAQVTSGPGSLGGTVTATTDGNGLASFGDLQINGLPGKYTIQFTAQGFTSATSQPITAALVPTTTAIVSQDPDPSTVGQPVTVGFSVQAVLSTFTGTVTVTSSGGESCNAPVSAGSCTITFLAAGDHTLTAAYGGDAVFAASTSAPVMQGVNDTGSPPAGGT